MLNNERYTRRFGESLTQPRAHFTIDEYDMKGLNDPS